MTPHDKRPVSVEDLLRLKRIERPAPEFWDGFDRELRAKQLAALVERRPWWHSLYVRLSGFRRYNLPVGAVAVLAVTFVTVRNYEPDAVDHGEIRKVAHYSELDATMHAGEADFAVARGDRSGSGSPTLERDVVALPGDYEEGVGENYELSGEEDVRTADAVSSRAALIWEFGKSADEALTPSARSIAANLAAAEAAEPAVVRRLLGVRHELDSAHVGGLREAVEPLQQMSSPAEVRLARFDSPMARTTVLHVPARPDSRLARDLDVYERAARRIGGGGDRLTLKF